MSLLPSTPSPLRAWTVLGVFAVALAMLAARAVYLQVLNSGYLQSQGNARHLRTVEDNSHRGMILDRNGEPLAISTPVDSVWAHPGELAEAKKYWAPLAKLLELPVADLAQLVNRHNGREFMYLKRHVTPELAERVKALEVPGVALTREYRRYYPAGAVAGHVVGFTNIDDHGQEGLELVYNDWLRATPGKKRVLKDRLGNIVETVESVSLPAPGKDLTISIDRRVQFLVYNELKDAVERHKARAASAVVLDARTGEVLAMVNEPGFNPNNRGRLKSQAFRNRAVTDVFEPGSTSKPFTVAAALESGKYTPASTVDTAPGSLQIGQYTIRDVHSYGMLTVSQVIEKSSNVGAGKIALSLPKNDLWRMYQAIGFGAVTGAKLPGESPGLLRPAARWAVVDQASIAYGYGVSVNALQLARAYGALANDGVLMPASLMRATEPPIGQRVMSAATAAQLRAMLEAATGRGGTGAQAQVAQFRVAGKTGTAHKLSAAGYAENNFIASFAGFAPASRPRLVMVIMVDDPSSGGHFGGQIAAPVFSKVMTGALRLLNIAPDNWDGTQPALVEDAPKPPRAAAEGRPTANVQRAFAEAAT
jgi:cell division protein FtsI (penicillin-binding protein 3)